MSTTGIKIKLTSGDLADCANDLSTDTQSMHAVKVGYDLREYLKTRVERPVDGVIALAAAIGLIGAHDLQHTAEDVLTLAAAPILVVHEIAAVALAATIAEK